MSLTLGVPAFQSLESWGSFILHSQWPISLPFPTLPQAQENSGVPAPSSPDWEKQGAQNKRLA